MSTPGDAPRTPCAGYPGTMPTKHARRREYERKRRLESTPEPDPASHPKRRVTGSSCTSIPRGAEYTRDIDEMLRIMRDSTPDQGYRITVTLDDLRGYQEGDVGWID